MDLIKSKIKGCSSHTTLVELLYPGGDKYRASVQIVLCNSFLYTNNIHKYYLVSCCVISIIIVIALTVCVHKYYCLLKKKNRDIYPTLIVCV